VLLVEGWELRRCFVGRFRRWEELGWERELAAFLFGMGWDWMGCFGTVLIGSGMQGLFVIIGGGVISV
jgi:hypothetical protein